MSEPGASATPEPTVDARRPVLAVFTSHWMAMAGVGLVVTGIVTWLCLLPVQLRSGHENPYIGVATAVASGVLVLGLVMTPLGLYLGRRRLQSRIATLTTGRTAWIRLIAFLLVTSALNLLITSQAAQRSVHHLESKQFCLSCHVHDAEARVFEEGPHAGILCVDCHVGDGNMGFIKSKLQGTEQLWAILTDSVHFPIETAIERGLMVPSDETCEDCHWKEQPAAARVRLIQRYAADEANTPETTLLTMNVGGRKQGGIHGAHHGEGVTIRFVAADARRQDIPLVEYVNTKTGVNRTYLRKGADAAALASSERITMQCFDCHNRPAHAFEMPDRAIDKAITMGEVSGSLPFLKQALELLTAEYPTREAAASTIPAALASYYAKEHPEVARTRAADVAEAGRVVADLHARNVWPALGVTWNTYPDNRGHQTAPGCFRCHGGEHETEAGEKITNNCLRCHYPAAVGETRPEVLEILGVDKLLRNMRPK